MIRQEGKNLSEIRDDHKARYYFAQSRLPTHVRVLDIGCGVGYGAMILCGAGRRITAIDRSAAAIETAERYYGRGDIHFICADLLTAKGLAGFPFATAFEIIEHVPGMFDILKASTIKTIFGSVPNEDVTPFTPGKSNPEHYRHFTPGEISDFLTDAGYGSIELFGQRGKHGSESIVTPGTDDKRTIVFVASRVGR